MSLPPHTTHLRSLYRSLLRELPSTTTTPTPLRHRLRLPFTPPSSYPPQATTQRQLQEAEQFIQYLRAQRRYATLLERYNPGMGTVDEGERVRLSARRVGMEMPGEWYGDGKEGVGEGKVGGGR